MAYTHATQTPNRQQFESSSQYSQSWNCGPTCVSFITDFYKNARSGIEQNRRLIANKGPYSVNGVKTWGAPPRTATSAWQQADMLDSRGIPSTPRHLDTVAQLHGLTDSGRRPIILGIYMARVPWTYRRHSFTGWHAVVVISGGYSGGVRGFWIMDPNFPAGSSLSRRFYPDWVMQSAWANYSPRWAVVPDAAKVVTVTAPVSTSIPRADYGAATMRFRARNLTGVLRTGKPVRNGAKVTATTVARTPAATTVHIIGEMKPTGAYDPWYIYAYYLGNGHAFCYSPKIDFSSIK
jgi:hypothetical protein